jgi:hypothetical protein
MINYLNLTPIMNMKAIETKIIIVMNMKVLEGAVKKTMPIKQTLS